MTPSPVPRPARFPAWAMPFSRRSLTAASMSPPVSSRARLQSIIPAWVASRSSLTSAAVGVYVTSLILRLACGVGLLCRRRLGLRLRRGLRLGCGLGLCRGLGTALGGGGLTVGRLGVAVLRHEVRYLDAPVAALGDAVGQDAHDERRRADRVVVP